MFWWNDLDQRQAKFKNCCWKVFSLSPPMTGFSEKLTIRRYSGIYKVISGWMFWQWVRLWPWMMMRRLFIIVSESVQIMKL